MRTDIGLISAYEIEPDVTGHKFGPIAPGSPIDGRAHPDLAGSAEPPGR